MIKLEAVHIEEVRGIRKLDIDFGRSTFAISGPNGSGKSGVIDAIEFALTGQIGRLTGRGTKVLSLAEHGPHVDKVKFPDAAFVTVRIFLPSLGKTVTITRKIKSPKTPKIEPLDRDIQAALAELADHPEVTLSRREILRFILVEPTRRSEEIQTILKLEQIGQTRSTLNSARNKLEAAYRSSIAAAESARTTLQRHLQIATLRPEDVLVAVNERRKVLGLLEFAELTADTKLDLGLSKGGSTSDFNKISAQRDLSSLRDAIPTFVDVARAEVDALLLYLSQLAEDPSLLAALRHRLFIEEGLGLVVGPECPLCDTRWDDEQLLRDHLIAKTEKSAHAHVIQKRLLDNAEAVGQACLRLTALLAPVQKLAERVSDVASSRLLSDWKADLEGFRGGLSTLQGVIDSRDRLAAGWVSPPIDLAEHLKRLADTVDATPDQTSSLDAQTFLTTAELRLNDYREAMRRSKAAQIASTRSRVAYELYCRILETELNALYDDVERDFSAFYRGINEDDESTFTAKLTPSEGSLALDVNFYDRGLYPPAAYHSEGHQDGMGVCLYLALMKRLFGARFTFALLDDVVMSVDAGHRYQFCKLLKTTFPDTQFVITTHDRLWAEQMKSAGLVTAKTSLAFHGWTIDTGPLVESHTEIWDEVTAALARGKVEVAAAALRHHLEYESRHLADLIGAPVPFRADGNYELGDLLPSVMTRLKELYGRAADAAQSWGNNALKDAVVGRKTSLSGSAGASNVEQWAVNKALHYNEWANFGRKDFEPVVAAFRDLLDRFRCADCSTWLHVSPRVSPESLRCSCGAISFNLQVRPKAAGKGRPPR